MWLKRRVSLWRCVLAVGSSLLLGVGPLAGTLDPAEAARAIGQEVPPGPAGSEATGLVSNALACLAIDPQQPGAASGWVSLTWQGHAESARLVLTASGAHAAHSVRVNGQAVGTVPVFAGGQACRDGRAVYLDVPVDVVAQGDNRIEISDDGLRGDRWAAANIRLEVFGPVAPAQQATAGATVGVAVAITETHSFTNGYDGSSQPFILQIPAGYNPATPTPLVVYVHGRNDAMENGITAFGPAANARGWLLASPQLHGHWPTPPSPPGIYAYASVESQYDVIGTVNYMVDHFNVTPDRIYLFGVSMGGQIAVVTAGKFPHVFAALFDNKGPTEFATWYGEQVNLPGYGSGSAQVVAMRQECYTGSRNSPQPQAPAGNPFCYERRSGLLFAGNLIHVPISMTHSVRDLLVPIHHSRDLRDAINADGPDRTAVLYEDNTGDSGDGGPGCNYHCYNPDPNAVLSFFSQFTLNNRPTHLDITTDQTKSYYWLSLVEGTGDHWSQVKATYDAARFKVTLFISDTAPLTVGINLGAGALTSTGVTAGLPQPGLGMSPGPYRIQGPGTNQVVTYTSGYLTLPIGATNQVTYTISRVTIPVYLPLVAQSP